MDAAVCEYAARGDRGLAVGVVLLLLKRAETSALLLVLFGDDVDETEVDDDCPPRPVAFSADAALDANSERRSFKTRA